MQITIKTIPHTQQRYDTTDDWQIENGGDITIFVSENENRNEVNKSIVHGLVECLLCIKHGISQDSVDEYDMNLPEDDNPGENVDAPYHLEHIAANIAEQVMNL